MSKKNGQTWLTEETLRIVITVLCLIILFGVLYAIYQTNANNQKIQLANASLSDITNRINNQEEQIKVYNVKGWVLSSWPYNGLLPKQCTDNKWTNCLCMCAKPGTAVKNYLVACQSSGVCIDNKDNFKTKGFQDVVDINDIPKILGVDYAKKTLGELSDLDLAKNSLNNLADDINNGRTGNSHSINPVGWQIASFPQEIPWLFSKKTVIPNSCSSWSKCMCIFPNDNLPWTNIADEADKGFCIQSPNSFSVNGVISIKDNLKVSMYPKIIQEVK